MVSYSLELSTQSTQTHNDNTMECHCTDCMGTRFGHCDHRYDRTATVWRLLALDDGINRITLVTQVQTKAQVGGLGHDAVGGFSDIHLVKISPSKLFSKLLLSHKTINKPK